jgi:signal peptidase I
MWFEPKHRKQARHLLHAARKLWNYRRDILAPAAGRELLAGIEDLREALRGRDRAAIARSTESLDAICVKIAPPPPDASIRENVEVIVIALVVVFGGIRPFVAQPFKIPTGSMQPTLNGIIVRVSEQPAPGVLTRIAHAVWYGRTYSGLVAPPGGMEIRGISEGHRVRLGGIRLFATTRIQTDRDTFVVSGSPEQMQGRFGLAPGRRYLPGEVVVQGSIDAGDWLFVDKLSYHFRRPRRGESFVFRTVGIDGLAQGQYYIKRLAGIPGDELRIDPPQLLVNGAPAADPGLQRVASARDGYGGYTNGGGTRLLGSPSAVFHVPADSYFALGDNSRNSLDGRYWGVVPSKNLVGPAFFVYWPFGHHFGPVR